MKISDFLNPELIIPELAARTKEEVLMELAEGIARNFPGVSADQLLQFSRLGKVGEYRHWRRLCHSPWQVQVY